MARRALAILSLSQCLQSRFFSSKRARRLIKVSTCYHPYFYFVDSIEDPIGTFLEDDSITASEYYASLSVLVLSTSAGKLGGVHAFVYVKISDSTSLQIGLVA